MVRQENVGPRRLRKKKLPRHQKKLILTPKWTSRSQYREKKKRKWALQSAPKLSCDGKDDWDIFKDKFKDYAEQMDWPPSECKACLKCA